MRIYAGEVKKTKKVQVTFDEEHYDRLSEIAYRDGKKLAGVVREAVEKYALGPESERTKRKALEELLGVEPAPAPKDYKDWKREYGGRKTKSKP
jgi:predicted DNA-binding protein